MVIKIIIYINNSHPHPCWGWPDTWHLGCGFSHAKTSEQPLAYLYPSFAEKY